MTKDNQFGNTLNPALKGGIKPPEADNKEGQDMAKAGSTWGGLKVETGIVPKKGGGGTPKYDWASFPKPTNPDDSATWPSVFIADVSGKTIYQSISKFRTKLQESGVKDIPEFTVSVSKEPKGVRVIRKS